MNMKMYKITKVDTWTDKSGKVRNWIKYMKGENIEDVVKYYGIDNILKVEEL